MAYQDPDNPRRLDDYIEQTGDIGWAPIVLALAFVVVSGLLIFGAPKSSREPSTSAQRSELPNTAPGVPSIPAPSPPKPQGSSSL
jgi:hypothetical protein